MKYFLSTCTADTSTRASSTCILPSANTIWQASISPLWPRPPKGYYSGTKIEATVVDALYCAFNDGARPLAEVDICAAYIARLHTLAEINARPAQVWEVSRALVP